MTEIDRMDYLDPLDKLDPLNNEGSTSKKGFETAPPRCNGAIEPTGAPPVVP